MPHVRSVRKKLVHDPRREVGSYVDDHSEEGGRKEESRGDGSFEDTSDEERKGGE